MALIRREAKRVAKIMLEHLDRQQAVGFLSAVLNRPEATAESKESYGELLFAVQASRSVPPAAAPAEPPAPAGNAGRARYMVLDGLQEPVRGLADRIDGLPDQEFLRLAEWILQRAPRRMISFVANQDPLDPLRRPD